MSKLTNNVTLLYADEIEHIKSLYDAAKNLLNDLKDTEENIHPETQEEYSSCTQLQVAILAFEKTILPKCKN